MKTIKKPRNIHHNGTSPAYAEATWNVDLKWMKVAIVKQQIPARNQHATLCPGAHHVAFRIQVPSILS